MMKVTMYKAQDGTTFDTPEEAEEHERFLEFCTWYGGQGDVDNHIPGTLGFRPNRIAAWLLEPENKNAVMKLYFGDLP